MRLNPGSATATRTRRGKLVGLVLAVLTLPGVALADDPFTYLVGTSVPGAACQYDNIQAAVDAAASHPGLDFIHVTTQFVHGGFQDEAFTVGTQDLEIIGGYTDCGSATPVGRTTISGAGGNSDSVIIVNGAGDRVLRNLLVIGGDEDSSSFGGGIDFNGTGELVLNHVIVASNRAGYGGGISVRSSGGAATLTLDADVVVQNNTAQVDGGGILVQGTARLFMLSDQTAVTANHALGGYGGGIAVFAPARADIGSPGYEALGVIDGNEAVNGGGIALLGGGDEPVMARLFTTNPTRPVRIHDNAASNQGGAVYVSAQTGGLCAYQFQIEQNRAVDGAAIYVDGAGILDGPDLGNCGAPESRESLGAAPCQFGTTCDLISGNRALDADDQPTSGATIVVGAGSIDALFHGYNLTIRDNSGGGAVRTGARIVIRLVNSLVAGNRYSADLILAQGTVLNVEVTDCTIAGNLIGFGYVFKFESAGYLKLERSIVHEPGYKTLSYAGSINDPLLVIHYDLTNEPTSLPQDGTLKFEVDPRFVDPARGDYHLQAASVAVDFAPIAFDGNFFDLDGYGRNQDLDLKPDAFAGAIRDLGAYERRGIDPLVLNGDFDADLNLWTNFAPATATWNAVDAGSNGNSGSLRVNETNTAPLTVNALRQCIHVPGPGTYRLAAVTRMRAFSIQKFPDTPVINWAYRPDSEDCSGAFVNAGTLLGTFGTGWLPTPDDAVITVGGEWGVNSTIEVGLEVRKNTSDPDLNSGISAEFDHVSLRAVSPSSALLIDGFE